MNTSELIFSVARRALLASVGATVLTLSACGGSDDSPSTETSPPPSSPTTPPSATTLKVFPPRLGLDVGGQAALQTFGAANINWSSSDPAVANVDTNGVVSGLAKGSATISVTSGSTVATAVVKVWNTAGAARDPTSDSLIAQALSGGRINSEQALIYRVFAFFGDDRLPPEFEGAPASETGGISMREVSGRLPSLSASGQATLLPFLIPPIYEQSWFAQQFQSTGSVQRKDTAAKRQANEPPVSCSLAPSLSTLPKRTTANFNIYAFGSEVSEQAQLDFFASVIEEIYSAETALLNRTAKSDSDENCNGGDGRIDIYLYPFGSYKTIAKTWTYPNRCEDVPSYIVLNSVASHLSFTSGALDSGQGPRKWKNYLAHEMMHVLQYAMDRGADCFDYNWIDEAIAEWAMDYVYQEDNLEDGLVAVAGPRSGVLFAHYLFEDHLASIETTRFPEMPGEERNGYADYIFFQFIALTHGASVIKNRRRDGAIRQR